MGKEKTIDEISEFEFEKIIPINHSDGLTPDKLRLSKGLENITEEEAKEIIFTYKRFAALVFEFYKDWRKDQA